MHDRWPMIHLIRQEGRSALWKGHLRPRFMSFEVEIAYRAPLALELTNPIAQQPQVRVLAPLLKPRKGDKEGSLPHVYWDDFVRPMLCLFDYETDEWTPMSVLADTTVPWTIDWLACYEGWRATGIWTGGGRHAGESSRR